RICAGVSDRFALTRGEEPRAYPVTDAPWSGSDVAGQAMPPLGDEAVRHRVAKRDVPARLLRVHGELPRACAAAAMEKWCVHHDTPAANFADSEREIFVVAVEEPVSFVETADRLHDGAGQAKANPVDHRDLLPWGT